ncbi:YqaE/Pmp3 family membrane protein, partial [Sphingomonas sp. TDK1]
FTQPREEGAGRPFQVACGLTVLGFLPGAAYALWRLLRRSRAALPVDR